VPTPRARRTVEEVGKLLRAADDEFRAYVALCAFAGLRKGEAAGTQVEDVEFLKRQLTISRQLQRDGREMAVCPPKYGSERTLYLPDDLVPLLSGHVATYVDQDGERWLFTSDGKPLHDNAITYRWRQARERAGLEGVRLHDLRHFYASGLIAAGCDVVTVQRALGHATATTTLNTYAHLWSTAEDRTRAAAADLLNAASAPADSSRTEGVR
jgi:integrase